MCECRKGIIFYFSDMFMNDFDEIDFDKMGDFTEVEKSGVKISWLTKILMKIWPAKGLSRLTRELGMNPDLMEKANELFFNASRIDLVPLRSGSRGFQIILDNKTSLYFYQDGDHFTYDGSEVGEYDNGDVTLFDDLK